MILSLGGQDQHGIYGWGGSVRGEKKKAAEVKQYLSKVLHRH